MKKINIVHIIGNLKLGGAEKSLLLFMQNIDRDKYNPIIITMFDSDENDFFYEDFKRLEIPIYHLKLKSWRDNNTFLALRKIIKKHKIDISHSHYGILEFYGVLFSRLAGVKHCIYTKHNIRKKSDNLYKFQRILLNKFLSQKVLSISKTVSNFLINDEYTPPSKIELVHNPILLSNTKINANELKDKYHIPKDKFIIGNTNRYAPCKGFYIFYKTIQTLIQNNKEVHAIITSSGEQNSKHKKIIEELNISSFVTIIPFQKNISLIYSIMDLFLMTSIHTEGFGMSMVEAMSSGVPTVGLNIGCISEIIEDSVTGILSYPQKNKKYLDLSERDIASQKLANSIVSLMNDLEKYNSIRKKAKVSASKYNVSNFTRRLEKIYSDLMK